MKKPVNITSICIVCSLYPNAITPASQVFVQKFVWEIANSGIECTVICPIAINLSPSLIRLPGHTTETTDKNSLINVYFPKFVSFGMLDFFKIKTARITTNLYYNAILRVWKKLNPKPQIIYGHFLTPGGISAARIGRKHSLPSFAAYGESSPWSIYNYGKEEIKKELDNLNGVVSVSTSNKNDLEKLRILQMQKVKVFPNGINLNHFYPRNKEQARKKFGFDQNIFLIAFVGLFSERKGVFRLSEAVRNLEDVQVAFAGTGSQKPNIANCVYSDVVKPEDVPDFLSAADVFVLPTLNEGCSNAIIEAMACGLPIVSSDLPFNKDILTTDNGILIDPNNIAEIREAIIHLKRQKEIRLSMGKASLFMSKRLAINVRAKNILDWMVEMM